MWANSRRPHRADRAPTLLGALLGPLLGALLGVVLVLGLTTPVDAVAQAPRPAAAKPVKLTKVKKVRLVKPTLSGDRATMTIKWARTPRAQKYRVRWSTTASMRNPGKAKVTGRALTLRNLAAGQTYCVQVRAVARGVKGKKSRVVCRTAPRLIRPGGVSVGVQQVQGATVAVRLQWARVAGATSYDVDYSPGQGDVQRDPKKITVGAAGTGAAVQTRVVAGLNPGRIYCFQVRARNKFGAGLRSSAFCKFTMPLSRAVPASSYGIDVGAFNICSNACSNAGRPWAARANAIRDRIVALDVDAMALQEAGPVATDTLVSTLAPAGFVKACQVGDGYPADTAASGWRNQVLFVRTAGYTVVPDSQRGLRFESVGGVVPSHGACWAILEEVGTGHRVIVASVHLMHPSAAVFDTYRYDQADALLNAISTSYPAEQFPGALPPVVLAGDFNSHRARVFDGPRERFEKSGYHDGYDVAARYDSPPTQNSFNGWRVIPTLSPRWGTHLDKVIAPAGAHVVSWGSLEPMANGRYSALLSDHSPIRVSLLIPTP